MSYTYGISFNGSDYQTFTPDNFPKVKISKEEGDFVWRTTINEIEIGKGDIYDTLETWYDDTDYHAYNIKIRIQKSAVTKWTFQFGIRQGKIDYELKTFTIEPRIVDPQEDIYYYKDRLVAFSTSRVYFYITETDPTPGDYYPCNAYRFAEIAVAMKNRLNALSDNTYSVQSAFLWNDNYPDESSPGANNYVSSDYNYLNDLAISRDNSTYTALEDTSIKSYLDLPKKFQCYWYCASDYTIHFEHASWFLDQISDYQLDLTGSDYYDDARSFHFSAPEVYHTEEFINPTDNEQDDWDGIQIVYEPELVGFTDDKIEVRDEFDSYLASDYQDTERLMLVGTDDLGVGWESNDFDTWTTDGINVTTGVAGGAGEIAYSNYLGPNNSSITYVIDIDYNGIPSNELEIQGYNDTSPVGSATSLSQGVSSDVVLGNRIAIKSTGAEGTFDFTLTLTATSRYRIPWEEGLISTDSLPNAYCSWANVIDRFWQYDRYGRTGTMNGSDYDFTTIKRVREQKEFTFYYASDINPMRGIKTDYGIGMIQTVERDLATDFITVTLRYE